MGHLLALRICLGTVYVITLPNLRSIFVKKTDLSKISFFFCEVFFISSIWIDYKIQYVIDIHPTCTWVNFHWNLFSDSWSSLLTNRLTYAHINMCNNIADWTASNWKLCFRQCRTSDRFCSHTMHMLNDKSNVSLFLAVTTILHANLKNSSLHQPLGTNTLGYFDWFMVFLLGKEYYFFHQQQNASIAKVCQSFFFIVLQH